MTPTEDQYRGALLGLTLGDALGAPHEGGPLERLLWRLLGKTPTGLWRYTDDTRMSIDLAQSLLIRDTVDQDDLALRFARSYRWDRGYGPGCAKVLKRIRAGRSWQQAGRSVYPTGSFGNGGAMRSPVIGLFFHDRPDALMRASRLAAEVTHAHPLAIEGAALIARATSVSLQRPDARQLFIQAREGVTSPEFSGRLDVAQRWIDTAHMASAREVRSQLGLGITAPLSCVTALYLAARFLAQPLEALIAFTAEAGGDVDTVSAMAGALWGAHNGAAKLSPQLIARVEEADQLSEIGSLIHARVHGVR